MFKECQKELAMHWQSSDFKQRVTRREQFKLSRLQASKWDVFCASKLFCAHLHSSENMAWSFILSCMCVNQSSVGHVCCSSLNPVGGSVTHLNSCQRTWCCMCSKDQTIFEFACLHAGSNAELTQRRQRIALLNHDKPCWATTDESCWRCWMWNSKLNSSWNVHPWAIYWSNQCAPVLQNGTVPRARSLLLLTDTLLQNDSDFISDSYNAGHYAERAVSPVPLLGFRSKLVLRSSSFDWLWTKFAGMGWRGCWFGSIFQRVVPRRLHRQTNSLNPTNQAAIFILLAS